MRADGGTLQLSGASGGIFTNNGTIEALNGSQVQLINNASLVGGTLATTGSSIHSLGSSLTNVTNNGDFVLDNNTTTTLVGALNNNGTVTFANAGTGVDLRLAGPVTLNGIGSVTLNNFSNNRLFANTSGDRFTSAAGRPFKAAAISESAKPLSPTTARLEPTRPMRWSCSRAAAPVILPMGLAESSRQLMAPRFNLTAPVAANL